MAKMELFVAKTILVSFILKYKIIFELKLPMIKLAVFHFSKQDATSHQPGEHLMGKNTKKPSGDECPYKNNFNIIGY